jgi:nicotinate phosphoribosyltransferase
VYKLESVDGRPTRKRSPGKATWPGIKQIWRTRDALGTIRGDLVTLEGEVINGAEPLLTCVMRQGRRLHPSPPLDEVAMHVRRGLLTLPEPVRALRQPATVDVTFGQSIVDLAGRLDGSPI